MLNNEKYSKNGQSYKIEQAISKITPRGKKKEQANKKFEMKVWKYNSMKFGKKSKMGPISNSGLTSIQTDVNVQT